MPRQRRPLQPCGASRGPRTQKASAGGRPHLARSRQLPSPVWNPGFYDGFFEARSVREHTRELLQRLNADEIRARGQHRGHWASTASGTEQANAQQGSAPPTNAQRQGDSKPKAQQVNSQRSGEQKARDRSQKTRDAILTYALENVAAILGNVYPLLNNALVRGKVVPMIAQLISMAIDSNSDSSGKEKAKRTETSIQKTFQALYPSNIGDIAATRVIEQVEMHYEVGVLASNPSSPVPSSSSRGDALGAAFVILIIL